VGGAADGTVTAEHRHADRGAGAEEGEGARSGHGVSRCGEGGNDRVDVVSKSPPQVRRRAAAPGTAAPRCSEEMAPVNGADGTDQEDTWVGRTCAGRGDGVSPRRRTARACRPVNVTLGGGEKCNRDAVRPARAPGGREWNSNRTDAIS